MANDVLFPRAVGKCNNTKKLLFTTNEGLFCKVRRLKKSPEVCEFSFVHLSKLLS